MPTTRAHFHHQIMIDRKPLDKHQQQQKCETRSGCRLRIAEALRLDVTHSRITLSRKPVKACLWARSWRGGGLEGGVPLVSVTITTTNHHGPIHPLHDMG